MGGYIEWKGLDPSRPLNWDRSKRMAEKKSWNQFLTPASDEELGSLYQQVTGKQTAPVGQTNEMPFYLRAAEMRGAAEGISTEQLLATYSERLRNSSYPSQQCLSPDEVQAYVSGAPLLSDRLEHAERCEGCRNLLSAVQPAPGVLTELLEDVRLMTARFSGRTRGATASTDNRRDQALSLRAASALFHR